jgi:hypothetical protein
MCCAAGLIGEKTMLSGKGYPAGDSGCRRVGC